MRPLRNRVRGFAAVALAWQAITIAAVSTVISCDTGPALEHSGSAGHEGMADCPMQKKEPACPLHAEKHGTHDCDCPTLGCSQTDAGFMALFGAVGILPDVTLMHVLVASSDAAPVGPASAVRLATVPLAPPPRT
ncbi:MAG TPA: hypothetical protein VJM31_03115 [Vicinamibacterales bacterium]|nr:hypothetical protein [Vicinamibacterales bacterium]